MPAPGIAQAGTSGTGVLVRDVDFYIAFITFRVGDCLYRVPRRPFEEKSTVFSDMFGLPLVGQGQEDNYNVCSDEEPLRLVGVDQHDFKSFLRVLLRNESLANSNMTINEWIGVLRLAKMWEFEEEKQKAIRTLDEMLDNGMIVRKLSIAREFDIKEWFHPICEELTTRTTALKPDEAPFLDPDFFLAIGRAREGHYKAILYWIMVEVLKPKCFCEGTLGADKRLVASGPEWYFKCDECVRVFTLDDAIRMTPQLRERTAKRIKECTSHVVKNVLVQRLTRSNR